MRSLTARITAILLLTTLISGCTRMPEPEMQIPTLASLPSNTPEPSKTATPLPIPTATLSPIPTTAPTLTPTPTPACESANWWDEVNPTLIHFLDTIEVANITGRGSLSPILLDLREVFRELENVDYPPCMAEIRNELVTGMDYEIRGFNQFVAESEHSSNVSFEVGRAHYWSAVQLLGEYDITPDSRLLGLWSILLDAETATWVAEVGENGVWEKGMTATWSELRTGMAAVDKTLTAVFSR